MPRDSVFRDSFKWDPKCPQMTTMNNNNTNNNTYANVYGAIIMAEQC